MSALSYEQLTKELRVSTFLGTEAPPFSASLDQGLLGCKLPGSTAPPILSPEGPISNPLGSPQPHLWGDREVLLGHLTAQEADAGGGGAASDTPKATWLQDRCSSILILACAFLQTQVHPLLFERLPREGEKARARLLLGAPGTVPCLH